MQAKRGAGTLADPLGIFSHGRIRALRKPQNIRGGDASPPSYIPAAKFVLLLTDRLVGLSWALEPQRDRSLAILNALQLSPIWRSRLDAARQGPGSGAPFMNALVHLLAEVYPLLREAARQKLKDLKTELNSPSVTASLKQLADQRPVFPELERHFVLCPVPVRRLVRPSSSDNKRRCVDYVSRLLYS